MDIGIHHAANGSVHGPMPRKCAHAFEGGTDHVHIEVTAPVTGPCMARMAVAVILDIQVHRGQRLLQCRTNTLDPFRIAHGSTFRNGRTSVRAYTPAAT